MENCHILTQRSSSARRREFMVVLLVRPHFHENAKTFTKIFLLSIPVVDPMLPGECPPGKMYRFLTFPFKIEFDLSES